MNRPLINAGVFRHSDNASGSRDMIQRILSSIVPLILLVGIETSFSQSTYLYQSEQLKIEQLADHTYRHISYMSTDDFGKVACNGMVVVDNGEALIFDTPVNDSATQELVRWIEIEKESEIKAVVPTHFHYDCLATLDIFHHEDIPSFANNKTIELAGSFGLPIPKYGFDGKKELPVGQHAVVVEYFGAGHTVDNVIAYFAPDHSLFGGCLVKSLGAGDGNLEDADVAQWPLTMDKILLSFPDAGIVIPGHGTSGGRNLLQYTKQLFMDRKE